MKEVLGNLEKHVVIMKGGFFIKKDNGTVLALSVLVKAKAKTMNIPENFPNIAPAVTAFTAWNA